MRTTGFTRLAGRGGGVPIKVAERAALSECVPSSRAGTSVPV